MVSSCGFCHTASMSTSLREKIVKYLAADIQQSVVASSCGVTPAYITQLLELPEVREEISLLRAAKLERSLETDDTLDSLEVAALKQVKDRLPFVRTAVEAVRIASTLNGMKRKATPDASADAVAAQSVTITVPRGASLMFKMNANNQVIEVEGRTMAPLPSKALPGLQQRLTDKTSDGITDLQVAPVHPFHAKQEQKDRERATMVLTEMTTYMDGVVVVL